MPATLRQLGKLPVTELGRNKISGAHVRFVSMPGSSGEEAAKPQARVAPRRGQASEQKHSRTRGQRRCRGQVSAAGRKESREVGTLAGDRARALRAGCGCPRVWWPVPSRLGLESGAWAAVPGGGGHQERAILSQVGACLRGWTVKRTAQKRKSNAVLQDTERGEVTAVSRQPPRSGPEEGDQRLCSVT